MLRFPDGLLITWMIHFYNINASRSRLMDACSVLTVLPRSGITVSFSFKDAGCTISLHLWLLYTFVQPSKALSNLLLTIKIKPYIKIVWIITNR